MTVIVKLSYAKDKAKDSQEKKCVPEIPSSLKNSSSRANHIPQIPSSVKFIQEVVCVYKVDDMVSFVYQS